MLNHTNLKEEPKDKTAEKEKLKMTGKLKTTTKIVKPVVIKKMNNNFSNLNTVGNDTTASNTKLSKKYIFVFYFFLKSSSGKKNF